MVVNHLLNSKVKRERTRAQLKFALQQFITSLIRQGEPHLLK